MKFPKCRLTGFPPVRRHFGNFIIALCPYGLICLPFQISDNFLIFLNLDISPVHRFIITAIAHYMASTWLLVTQMARFYCYYFSLLPVRYVSSVPNSGACLPAWDWDAECSSELLGLPAGIAALRPYRLM